MHINDCTITIKINSIKGAKSLKIVKWCQQMSIVAKLGDIMNYWVGVAQDITKDRWSCR